EYCTRVVFSPLKGRLFIQGGDRKGLLLSFPVYPSQSCFMAVILIPPPSRGQALNLLSMYQPCDPWRSCRLRLSRSSKRADMVSLTGGLPSPSLISSIRYRG